MQKRRFDGHLMQFSTPIAGAVLPKELAGPKSGKLLAMDVDLFPALLVRDRDTVEVVLIRSSAKMAEYDFVSGDVMPAILPKRKPRAAPFKTSALESAGRAGIAGVFAGPPDLAANRKKYLREKLCGKAGTAR